MAHPTPFASQARPEYHRPQVDARLGALDFFWRHYWRRFAPRTPTRRLHRSAMQPLLWRVGGHTERAGRFVLAFIDAGFIDHQLATCVVAFDSVAVVAIYG